MRTVKLSGKARAALVLVLAAAGWGLWSLRPPEAEAHCDTLDGPVAQAAREALEKGDVTPVLKWVKKEQEGEIRAVFAKTLAVRAKGTEARELADTWFIETLVRIHRAGEGAPFTGLKPAGAEEPVVAASDRALAHGSADELVKHVTEAVTAGIRERFARALEASKHANESVEAGREFVAAYVEYVHYVERLHNDAKSAAHAEGHGEAPTPAEHHH